MPTVRYFAAAAEAAGTESETVDGATLGAVRQAMVAAHGARFERVLAACAVLVDGVREPDEADVGADAVVDVLPPFAGG